MIDDNNYYNHGDYNYNNYNHNNNNNKKERPASIQKLDAFFYQTRV